MPAALDAQCEMPEEMAAGLGCQLHLLGLNCSLAIDRVVFSLEGGNFRDMVGAPNKDMACSCPLLAGEAPGALRQGLNLACLWSWAWHMAEAPATFSPTAELAGSAPGTCVKEGAQSPRALVTGLASPSGAFHAGSGAQVVWECSCSTRPLLRG